MRHWRTKLLQAQCWFTTQTLEQGRGRKRCIFSKWLLGVLRKTKLLKWPSHMSDWKRHISYVHTWVTLQFSHLVQWQEKGPNNIYNFKKFIFSSREYREKKGLNTRRTNFNDNVRGIFRISGNFLSNTTHSWNRTTRVQLIKTPVTTRNTTADNIWHEQTWRTHNSHHINNHNASRFRFQRYYLKKEWLFKEKLGSGRAIPTIKSVLEFGEALIRIPAGIRLSQSYPNAVKVTQVAPSVAW
jgi:hypothetical protein